MTGLDPSSRSQSHCTGADGTLAQIIQGGMGIGVSGWELARAVALTGQLGVVSGVALDTVLARRLQSGDHDGSVRRALERFPLPAIAEQIVENYFVAGGIAPDQPFRPTRRLRLAQRPNETAMTVAGNFVEIFLAKEGHTGMVGVNYLEKLQMATPPAALGAIMAGVDYVLMGAGIPAQIPKLLDDLSQGKPASVRVDVDGSPQGSIHELGVDPADYIASNTRLGRPRFLAVVASHVLAQFLARDPLTCPDGFVVETPIAGGHSAPPRGKTVLDDNGEPVYGERDLFDATAMKAIGLPFWLAGGYGSPEGLKSALGLGATGIQVGSAFALSKESGLQPDLRSYLIEEALEGRLHVRNDALASSTGFPFKMADVPSTVSNTDVYATRRRICDLGYLRVPYIRSDGNIGYRCASEPVTAFARKGGKPQATIGRRCLCNGLLSTIGLAQRRANGYVEPALVTLGQDLSFITKLATPSHEYCAADVVRYLLG